MIILRQKNYSLFSKLHEKIKNYYNKYYNKYPNSYYKDYNKKKEEKELKKERDILAFENLSPKHKELIKMNKLMPEKPSWGDGDEYPCFHLFTNPDDDRFGGFCLGFQNQPEYKWDGKNWTNNDNGKKVNNLKSDMIKALKCEYEYWESMCKKYPGDFDDVKDETLNYINDMISVVKNSRL